MKTNLKEPEDKAIEGANKAAKGCGMIVTAIVSLAVIAYAIYVLCS